MMFWLAQEAIMYYFFKANRVKNVPLMTIKWIDGSILIKSPSKFQQKHDRIDRDLPN